MADFLFFFQAEDGIRDFHVTGVQTCALPICILRAVFNTTGGIPIVSDKGRQDLKNLAELSARSSGQQPTRDSVLARMQWLLYEGNWDLLNEELVGSRLAIYSRADFQASAPLVYGRLKKVNEGGTPDMIELEKVQCESLLLWTSHNPIHDVAAAES